MSDDWREVSAEWQGELGFIGANQTGGTVQMGSVAGKPGASPMELLLLSLAGCTGMDVASILVKMRQNLVDMKISVRGKRAEDHPKIYTEIEVLFDLWGDLDPKAVENAIELSEYKYCSVSAMLNSVAQIHTRFTIHPVVQDII